MPDKQSRYRKRQAAQDFHRIEILVPSAGIAHLKAYARALRDAYRLGVRIPAFDGMLSKPDGTSGGQMASVPTTATPKHEKPETSIVSGGQARRKKTISMSAFQAAGKDAPSSTS